MLSRLVERRRRGWGCCSRLGWRGILWCVFLSGLGRGRRCLRGRLCLGLRGGVLMLLRPVGGNKLVCCDSSISNIHICFLPFHF